MGRKRKVKTDFEPDVERLRSLLERAKGTRSIYKFSDAAGMSYSYIYQYMKGHIQTPMTPETLIKVAAVAWNDVSLEELFEASGYSAEKCINWSLDGIKEEEEEYKSLDEVHERTFLKKAAYLWFIKKKGFIAANVQDNGGPFVLMKHRDEVWLLIFMNVRDGRACARAREGLLMFYSMDEYYRKLCIVVDDPQICARDFLIPSLTKADGMILYVDPYTGAAKPIGG